MLILTIHITSHFLNIFIADIWSGDKALIKGLEKKGFKKFISTEELFKLREQKLK